MTHRSHPAQARALTSDLQAFVREAGADFGTAAGPEMAGALLAAMTSLLEHLELAHASRIAAEAAIESLREAVSTARPVTTSRPHPWEDTLASLEFALAESRHDAYLARGGSHDPEDMVVTPEVADAEARLDSAVRAAAQGLSVEQWRAVLAG